MLSNIYYTSKLCPYETICVPNTSSLSSSTMSLPDRTTLNGMKSIAMSPNNLSWTFDDVGTPVFYFTFTHLAY